MPYHPIIDLLRYNCGITEADSPEAITAKVHGALHEVGMDIEAFSPYLLQLLGVKEGTERLAGFTPEAIKTRTFETLRQMSLHGSQRRPLVFEIEDLHWCDNTSEDYLAWLVESVAGAAILLLVTYRPGYRPPWLDKSYATQIALRHLAPQESITVVRSTRQHQALSEHLEQMIIAKAEGNPFFLEELTRAVIEHAHLGTDVTVPETIQGVLMARIDRLPEAPKRLLQTAAVLGREVSPPLLEAIWEVAQPLGPLLLTLTRQEFLFTRPGAEGKVLSMPFTRNPDLTPRDLSKTAIVEVVDRYTISDGQREVIAYLAENPHAEGMLIGYIPDARLGFVTDLWSPGAAPLPEKITPGLTAVVNTVKKVGNAPLKFAGGHGATSEYAPLAALAGN